MNQLWDIQICFIGTKNVVGAGFDPTFQRFIASLSYHWTTKKRIRKIVLFNALSFWAILIHWGCKENGLWLSLTHTHTAGPFSILAIKDAWGQIKVNVEEFPIFWEMILLQEGFFHDHFDICPNLEKSSCDQGLNSQQSNTKGTL